MTLPQLSPRSITRAVAAIMTGCSLAAAAGVDGPPEAVVGAPHGMRVLVKRVGPTSQPADLQVLCILAHNPAGDPYIDVMRDLDDRLGGLISAVRQRGEFTGEPGETFLFTPPARSIAPARVLLIGVGAEPLLTLDRLRLVGRVAAREAVRLGATHVAFAPALRDQGSSRIDVGDCDAAVVGQFLLAYDTESRLQGQGLAPPARVEDLTVEAGPKYFDAAASQVAAATAAAAEQIGQRDRSPYAKATPGR
jgi:hypothetical protein